VQRGVADCSPEQVEVACCAKPPFASCSSKEAGLGLPLLGALNVPGVCQRLQHTRAVTSGNATASAQALSTSACQVPYPNLDGASTPRGLGLQRAVRAESGADHGA